MASGYRSEKRLGHVVFGLSFGRFNWNGPRLFQTVRSERFGHSEILAVHSRSRRFGGGTSRHAGRARCIHRGRRDGTGSDNWLYAPYTSGIASSAVYAYRYYRGRVTNKGRMGKSTIMNGRIRTRRGKQSYYYHRHYRRRRHYGRPSFPLSLLPYSPFLFWPLLNNRLLPKKSVLTVVYYRKKNNRPKVHACMSRAGEATVKRRRLVCTHTEIKKRTRRRCDRARFSVFIEKTDRFRREFCKNKTFDNRTDEIFLFVRLRLVC